MKFARRNALSKFSHFLLLIGCLLAQAEFSFAAENRYIAVIGDSLADGVWAGLYRAFHKDKHTKVIRETQNSSGLTAYDWQSRAARLLTKKPIDTAVIMMGANDGQALLRHGKPRLSYRSEGWEEAYRERVEALMQLFEDKKMTAIWVGLPIMRSEDRKQEALLFNRIYQTAAARFEYVHFVPTWELTANDEGQYAAYAVLDDSGKKRLMRANDGVHFTDRGYSLLAQQVLKVLNNKKENKQEASSEAQLEPPQESDASGKAAEAEAQPTLQESAQEKEEGAQFSSADKQQASLDVELQP